MKRAKTEHEEPSAESLREIPPADLASSVRFGRGTDGMRRAMEYARATRGRPRNGEKAAGSSARSLRLSDDAWAEIERAAEQRKVPVSRLLALIVAEWLYAPKMKSRDERALSEVSAPAERPFKGKDRVRPAFKGKARVRPAKRTAAA